MKKLLLSFLIYLGIMMISSQTFAQALDAPGMKLKPYSGATYSYTFDVAVGLEYEFYFSNSADGINKVGLITDIESVMTGATGTVTAGNPASVSIVWANDAATTYPTGVWLFVHVKKTLDDNICDNYNAVFIQPLENSFDVIASATGDINACPTFTGFKAVVAPTDVYNSGTSIMNFEFNRTGSVNQWNLAYSIAQVGTGDYTYSFNGGTPVSVSDDDDTKLISSILVTGDTQTLQIVLKNVPGDNPQFTVTATGVTDNVTKVGPSTLNSNALHTIKVMPIIGTFQ